MKFSTYVILAIGIWVLGAWLFFFEIEHHSLWSDELITAQMVIQKSQSEIWKSFDDLAPYYSLVKSWSSFFGTSEAGLRSFSAFSAVIAVTMILILGPFEWGLGYLGSLASSLIFILSPMMLYYAQEARYYALLQPLCLASCGCYLKFWKTRNGRWLLGWALFSSFSILTHPFMIFGVVAISCYGFWLWKKNQFQQAWTIVSHHALVVLSFLMVLKPLITSYQMKVETEQSVYRLYTDEFMPWKVLLNFLTGIYEHGSVVSASILLLAATVILILHVQTAQKKHFDENLGDSNNLKKGDPKIWIFASLGAGALMISISWFFPYMVEGKRYVMVFFAPFCICLGSALLSPSLPRLTVFIFIGVMGLNSLIVDWLYFTQSQKQNWRLAGEFIKHNAQEGDVWLHQNQKRGFVSEYYGGGKSLPIKNIVWEPETVHEWKMNELKEAKRVWIIKTGSIADLYKERLLELGFQHAIQRNLPSGTHFRTQLWLFERRSPFLEEKKK